MGRPPGSPNKPGGQKPGRKPKSSCLPHFSDAYILKYKVQILELMTSGNILTLTEAARQLGIPPIRVHAWTASDKDFGELVKLTREVRADELEEELSRHANFIPKMMILKGYRPMFREGFKVTVTDDKTRELLEELKKLAVTKEETEELEEEEKS